MENELCSESIVTVMDPTGSPRVKFIKGPRFKTGIAMGPAKANPHGTTGRMAYRGKVINRAARVSKFAIAGQVLCSDLVWEKARNSETVKRKSIQAISLGQHSLKVTFCQVEGFM